MLSAGSLFRMGPLVDHQQRVERRRALLERAEAALLHDAGQSVGDAAKEVLNGARQRSCASGGYLTAAQERRLSEIVRRAGFSNGIAHGH